MIADEIRAELRAALAEAMREQDRDAVTALRAGIARLDNAEATGEDEPAGSTEDSPTGRGADDVPRHELSEHEVQFLLAAEVDEREIAAAHYDRLGEPERAEHLRAQADALAPWTT
ncbi:hypothetical protein [Calidifontibacter terrae]